MKKLIFIFSVFLIVFFIGSKADATSGTCSWHNGVNCSVGSDADGSVICNDGWRDSSEKYASIASCQQMSCTESELRKLQSDYNVYDLQDQIFSIQNQIIIINANLQEEIAEIQSKPVSRQYMMGQIERVTNDANFEISQLNTQKAFLENNLQYANWQIDSQCSAMGYDRWLEMQIEALRRETQAQGQAIQNAQNDTMDNVCAVIPNAYNDNGTCRCKDGYSYFASKGTCETPERACLDYFQYSKWENGQCNCKDGYEFITNNCFKLNIESNTPKETTPSQPSVTTSKNEVPKETFIDLKGSTEANIIPAEQPSETISQNSQPEQAVSVEKKQNPIIKFFQKIFSKIGSWFKR